MSNLTQGIPLQPYGQAGREIDLPLKANAQIWMGAMVSEVAGAACTGTTASAGPCVGVAEYDALGGASDGTTRIRVHTDRIFLFAAGTAAPTDATPIGSPLFMETDNTVGTGGSAGGATFQYAGRFAGIQDDGQVRVYIDFRAGQSLGDGRVSGGAITDAASSTIERAARFTVFSAPTLSQNSAVTLGTTGAVVGDVVRINRSDAHPYTLSLVNGGGGAGTLGVLSVASVGFIQAAFDGTNWYLDGISATSSESDNRVSGGAITDASSSTIERAARFTVFSAPTLSQNSAVTIGTTGAVVGDVVKINRSDTSAYTLALVNGGGGAGTLATIVASKVGFIQAAFDGTNWYLDGVSAT